MIRDTFYFKDIHSDLFITHGGLLSKKVVRNFVEKVDFGKVQETWKIIRKYVLEAVNTHDEVGERQPVLCDLFRELKLGKDISPLQREGDILLRDFIVEVKQPSSLRLSSIESFSTESNDQQLLRAMRNRNRHWGILTNASEWQFVFDFDGLIDDFAIPFISFSILDMINDEEAARSQICLFVQLLTNREVRKHLIKSSSDQKAIATSSFSGSLQKVIDNSISQGLKKDNTNRLIELCFRLTFLFYAEDIGALPRMSRRYRAFDIRSGFTKTGKFNPVLLKKALMAFAEQTWCKKKIPNSGNSEFWSEDIETFINKHAIILNNVQISSLWFDDHGREVDLSEMSSSDLCDVYQHCVYFDEKDLGTVYTNARLSNFINHWVTENLKKKVEAGDIILDPACGSGHLLKRLLFLAKKMVKSSAFNNQADMLKYFCENHLMGIDKNPTAVFITKLNLWLTCIRAEQSLPALPRIQQDNTLKRFESSFKDNELEIAKFLDGQGTRVLAVISNPPWSMVTSDHSEFDTLKSEFWNERKGMISAGKNNLALNFLYLIDHLVDRTGVATVIMPGVFFVGSDSKIRDQLIDRIDSYLPVRVNKDFEGVATSQNYGIIGFSKKPNDGKIKTYFSDENNRNKIVPIDKEIYFSPGERKKSFKSLVSKFPTDTLLPLFMEPGNIKNFKQLLASTSAVVCWSKGNKSKTLKGNKLIGYDGQFALEDEGLLIATPENRGGSPRALHPVVLDKKNFANCHHKVLKFQFDEAKKKDSEEVLKFLRSDELNTALNTLRTMASIQSATLNFIGLPSDIAKLSYQKDVLKAGELLEAKAQRKSGRKSAKNVS